MIHEVIVPQLGVNDEFVTIVEWLVKEGDKVEQDAPLCVIETSKATTELTAEQSGYVRIKMKPGQEVKIKEPIAHIVSSLSVEIKEDKPAANNSLDAKATRKARELAEELGVALEAIPKQRGIIREKDVRSFFEAQTSQSNVGQMDEKFLSSIADDPAFPQLASEEKIALYKKNGAEIGQGVSIGKGTLLLAKRISIGEDASIGSNCYIKADEFVLGRMSVIGDSASIVTRKVKIGDVFFSGRNIIIGGGGAYGQHSSFETGNNCLVSNECIINTAERVVFGNEVGLSPGVQIFTHNHWQNVLKGYFANFGPVFIGDQAYITGNCLVAPNLRIGKGATVLANSSVISNVEDYTVVAGVPAKKIKTVNTNLSFEKKDRIMQRIMIELKEMLAFKGFDPEDVLYVQDYDQAVQPKPVVLAFSFKNGTSNLPSVVFDLTNYQVLGEQTVLSDEVRNFLRKRGIRFKPIYWRYTADQGFFN